MLALAACTPERDQSELFAPQDVDLLVIDAVLLVGQEYPVIRLTRTLAPDVPFNQDSAGEVGAAITIKAMIDSVGMAMPYLDVPGEPGYYQPNSGGGFEILPETEYRLTVRSSRGENLTARTLTPARFSADEWLLLDPSGTTELRTLQTFADAGDSVFYRPENQLTYAEGLLEVRFTSGGAAAFAAVGYQLALFSIDLDSDYVIDPPFFEEDDFQDLARMGSSPALIADNGRVRLPWFSIYFQGRHVFKVYTIDLNWYDLVRSTPQTDGGLGFGGNVGETADRPIFRVEGGIGLFGSASVDSVGFFVLPAE